MDQRLHDLHLRAGPPVGRVDGVVLLTGLPPHRGLMMHLHFYRVESAVTPPPYNGEPPEEAAVDVHEIVTRIHLDTEVHKTSDEVSFSVEYPAGFYYPEVRAILLRSGIPSVFAQAEGVFYRRRPIEVPEQGVVQIRLPVAWPQVPMDELHYFGTIRRKDDTASGDFEETKRARNNPGQGAGEIEVVCEDCGKTTSFPKSLEGTTQECSHCHAYIDVGDLPWDDDFGVPDE
jgi:hypothetical protein